MPGGNGWEPMVPMRKVFASSSPMGSETLTDTRFAANRSPMHTPGMKIVHRAQPSWGVGEILQVHEDGRFLEVRFAGRQGPPFYVSAKDPAVVRFHYAVGDEVHLADGRKARVLEVRESKASPFYRYLLGFADGTDAGLSEVEIVPKPPRAGALEQLSSGQKLKAGDFALRDRAVRLDLERRADALGALFGSRVMPKPHQLAVVNRVLSARVPRFVLADEVGLGKTIEAGMVYAALANTGLAKRVLVVAPAHLTVQWLAELYHKFHSLFTLLDGERLAKEAEADPRPAWWRFPKVVTSLELLARSEEHREAISDPAARWDLVIFDEAHHLVSPKAFEAAEAAADNSHGLLLLTATPLQLDPEEHFKLLSLVDPATPESYEEFRKRLKRQGDLSDRTRELLAAEGHAAVVKAASAIAKMLPQDDILEEKLDALREDEEGAREAFVTHLAEAYSISSRLIRNRRALVGGLAPRRLVRHDVTPSPAEKALRDAVRERLASGDLRASGAALASLLKRLDSSPRAAAAALAAQKQKDLATQAQVLEGPSSDGKARALIDLMKGIQRDEPGAKVLVFCEARESLDYVRDVLGRAGFESALYHGDLTQLERDRQVARFRDPEGPQVLISSEVGGEGRNFQFCHHLVNFDLAWSPAAVEQRIGRLDRIGQHSEVQVHCFRVEGSVGARVFDLMADAVRVFDETVGGLDPVLERVEATVTKLAASGDDSAFDTYRGELEAKVARAREEVRRAWDPLLDVRSYDKAGVRKLIDRAASRLGIDALEEEELEEALGHVARELDERLEEEVVDLARRVGITADCEEHVEAFQCQFKLGGEMAVDALPGVDLDTDQPILGSFWRDTAVVQEENDYFATGHPLVEALFSWARDGELGRAAWLFSDHVRSAALGFAFTFLVAFPEAEDAAAGSRVPSRQAARYLENARFQVAVELARGGDRPRVRQELLEDLEEADGAPAPRAPADALAQAVGAAFEAAKAEADLRLKREIEGAIGRLEADRDQALERLVLAARRADEYEVAALEAEADRINLAHAQASRALRGARLELDQAAGLLPR